MKELLQKIGLFCVRHAYWVCSGLGALVILGWLVHAPLLIQVNRNWAPMQFNTALLFLLLGIAIRGQSKHWPITTWLSSTIALFAGLTLIQYLAHVNLGIDQLLMRAYIMIETSHPGRMAPNTAVCFTLMGLGLLNRRPVIQLVFFSMAFSLSFIAFVGYLSEITPTYGWASWTRMAIHTSLGFLVAGFGSMGYLFLDSRVLKLDLAWPILVISMFICSLLSLGIVIQKLEEERQSQFLERHCIRAQVEIEAKLEELCHAMNRMGLRFQTTHQTPSDWDLDIRSYLRDFNLLDTLCYLDADFRVRFEIPKNNPSVTVNYQTLRDMPALLAFKPNDLDTRLVTGNANLLCCVTQIPGKEQIKGYLVGTLSLPTLIQNLRLESQGLYLRWADSTSSLLYQSPLYPADSDFSLRKFKLLEDQVIQFNFSQELKQRSTSRSFYATKYFMFFSVLSFLLLLLMFWGMNKRHQETLDARQAAEEANRYKSQFLANMSHEIRTPLNAILGLSNLLEDSNLSPKQRDFLHKIQSSSSSLLGIINDILDFSKVEAGKLSIEETDFNLEQVFDNLRNLFSTTCYKKGLQLYFDLDLNLPHLLEGDPLRINQILTNLLSNALKFTHTGEIWVSAQASHQDGKDWLNLSVEDTGIGITEAQIQKIFQPFNQATAATTRQFGGSGLGLTISRRLAELMGGSLNVRSSEGQGSTFTLLLPLKRSAVEDLLNKSSTLNPVRTLVVVDNESARQIITNILTHWGYPISEARNVEEARQQVCSNEPPQLILLDWNLPDLDGVKFLRETKASLPHCQFIMITAHDRNQLEREIRDFNLLPVLEKPITPSTLFNGLIQLQSKGPTPPIKPVTPGQVRMNGLGRRILVVEDNAINITVIRSLLDRWNFVVSVAQDGQEAVSIVQTQKFDIILMDLHMPNMDGKQATATIRANGYAPQTPIIALSAAAMVEEIDQSRQAGMDGFISKPINFSELALCIKKFLPQTELIQLGAANPPAETPTKS